MSKEKTPNVNMHPRSTGIMIFTILFALATLIVGILFLRFYISGRNSDQSEHIYDRYYVMITDDHKSSFWQSVYAGAQEAAANGNAFVELMGANLSYDYTPEQLMEIAISSHVDGIMVYGGDTEQMTSLIDEASLQGIPVVTVYSDNPNSKRCSFVGISGYNIGREYGRQVLNVMGEKQILSDPAQAISVTMLIDAKMPSNDQNVIMSGMKDSLTWEETETEYSINTVAVDDSNPFSVEESIRNVFMQQDIPDILICLNELDTTCAYQAAIDYNKVGSVYILGYYDSDKILNAISRNVVFSSLAVDTQEMGRYCVEALEEYNESGNTSQYFTADTTLIDRNNVAEYLARQEENDAK